MSRYTCDEDGWRSDRHYSDAQAELEAIVREDYGDELEAILKALRADETGAAWVAAERAIVKLADSVTRLSDVPFTSREVEAEVEAMIERDL